MKKENTLTLDDSEEDKSEWYETKPGVWSTSTDQVERIEMAIQEILWRLRSET